MPIKGPTADLIGSYDILDEEDSVGEPERQLVEQFDVFQDVVVGGTGVRIFVVMTINQQFDYGFHGIGRDQSLVVSEKKQLITHRTARMNYNKFNAQF